MNKVLLLLRFCMSLAVQFFMFFCPALAMTTVKVSKAGTLGTVLTQAQQDTCTSLIIQGKLNSSDIKVLRRMAGGETDGGMGQLSVLDLREAKFVNDKEPFMSLDAAACRLAGTAVPEKYRQSASVTPVMRNGADDSHCVYQYRAQYYLGYSEDSPKIVRGVADGFYNGYLQPMDVMASSGDYRFALGITDAQWREMEEYGVTSFKGHRIVRENGRFILRAYLVKSTFLADMFYGCTSLRVLVLPRKMKMDFSVMDETAHYRIVRMNR